MSQHWWRDEYRALGLSDVAEALLTEAPATEPAPGFMLESAVVYEEGIRMLEEEYRPRVASVRQWAELNSRLADMVHEAADRDLERIDRRRRAEHWRSHHACAGLPGAAR